jgi:ABC-2 type transport system ATP-binding protein
MANAIEVRGLRREFGKLTAVKDVSFEVAEGELFGFLGPNGAGKTTTINMLCTLLRPTAGSATVNGFDVVHQRSEVRRSIGLVFQQTTLDEYLSAEQNLRFHAYAYGVPADVREPRIRELLTMVELWDRRKGSVRTFSGGMKRRLEIARGLLHHPRVLFLDEPTLGLDPQTRRHIWDYLLRLREQEQLTIFLTTQYLDEAEYCARIAIIDSGQIVALDTPDGLKRAVGGDLITFSTADNAALLALHERYARRGRLQDGTIRFHVAAGETFLPEFVRSFPQPLAVDQPAPAVARRRLPDLTGHEIRDAELDAKQLLQQGMPARRTDGRGLARHVGGRLPRAAALRQRALAGHLGSLAFPLAFLVIFGAGFGQVIGSLAPGVDFIQFMYPGHRGDDRADQLAVRRRVGRLGPRVRLPARDPGRAARADRHRAGQGGGATLTALLQVVMLLLWRRCGRAAEPAIVLGWCRSWPSCPRPVGAGHPDRLVHDQPAGLPAGDPAADLPADLPGRRLLPGQPGAGLAGGHLQAQPADLRRRCHPPGLLLVPPTPAWA